MSDSAAYPRYSNPDCHYGDHYWVGGACSRCGLQLRCGACGRFVTVDGLDKHIGEDCPIKWEVYEDAAA